MTTLLKMTHPSLRQLKKSRPELNGKMLGRGSFTVVYPRDQHSVWKLSIDPYNYGLATSDLNRQSEHFIGAVDNRGIVGYLEELPIYLYAVERLYPVKDCKITNHLVKDFSRRYEVGSLLDCPRHPRDDHAGIAQGMAQNMSTPGSLRHAMTLLHRYIMDNDCSLDLGNRANFMRHPDGRLILSDPIYHETMLDEYMEILNPPGDELFDDENWI